MPRYETYQDPLYNIVPSWVLENTRTEVRVPERVCATCAGGFIRVPSRHPNALVKIGSNPEPGVIVLHPEYYDPTTASGQALRAHELYHIGQRQLDPDFAQKFASAAEVTERRGLPPWENPYEKPAYEFEKAVKKHLMEAKGMPE
jgi:hypothetical protein